MVFITTTCTAQTLKARNIKHQELTRILHNMQYDTTFVGNQYLCRLYVVGLESGSAHLEESDEIAEEIFITLSQYGEIEKEYGFHFKPYCGLIPNFSFIEEKSGIKVSFEYGCENRPQKVQLLITEKGFKILK